MRHLRIVALGIGLLAVGCGSGSGPGTDSGVAGSGGGSAGGSGGGGSGGGGSTGTTGAGGTNAAQNPIATINHPGDGETRAANAAVPFVGVATDPQDGTLTGAALVWTRDQVTQPIGTGEQFSATLPVGDHVITLTATDSDGNKGTASITLHIQ